MYQEVQQTQTRFSQQNFAKLIDGLTTMRHSKQQNKRFLVSSYRKLQKIVNKKHNFWYLFANRYIMSIYQKEDIVQEVFKYAQSIQPYMVGDFNVPAFQQVPDQFDKTRRATKFYEQSVGMRQCFPLKIRVDGQLIEMDPQKNSRTIYKNLPFNLTLESQPNSFILYTTNSKHPLLVDNYNSLEMDGKQKQLYICFDRQQRQLKPPCTICAIVKSQQNLKMQSQLYILHVKSSQAHNHLTSVRNNNTSNMVRPQQSGDLNESLSSVNDSYLNIDRPSHSS